MKKPERKRPPLQEHEVDRKALTRRNFISFGVFAGAYGLGYSAWRWLYNAPPEKRGITSNARKPLRKALNQNELLFRNTLSPKHLAKTYPKSMAAKQVRQNGDIGLTGKFNPADWQLTVKRSNGDILTISFEELKKLPKTEIVFDFKCVEGWDQIQHWGGVRFSDFIAHFGLQKEAELNYAGFVTPDAEYYVGIDMPSAMHPQTLLAFEMNGKPLPLPHGYPLRLIIPVKYGIKNLKRIQTISFSNTRPPDYWAEQGYDYYSGL